MISENILHLHVMAVSSASFVNTTQLLHLDRWGKSHVDWWEQYSRDATLKCSCVAMNDREETTATAMASVKTSLLVALVVFVQFVELTLGGCVSG